MPDGSAHNLYSVDTAAVRQLAARLTIGAGDTAGEFVLGTISDRGAVQHYAVSNGPNAEKRLVDLMQKIGAEAHQNVYYTAALFKPGSIVGKAGRTKANVLLVLGAVCDFDAKNDPRTRHDRLPMEPSAEIETSPGNIQSAYWFEEPLSPEDATPLLWALAETCGADDCKTIEHLWRCPGTWNWPSAKKVAAGRSQVLFLARWEGIALDETVAGDDLRAAIMARDPAAFDQGHKPQGSTAHKSQESPAHKSQESPAHRAGADWEFDWEARKRPGEPAEPLDDPAIVRALTKDGDRSELAFRLLRRLQRANYSAAEALAVLIRFQELPVMQRYGGGDERVRADVQRAFAKPDQPSYERPAADAFREAIARLGADAEASPAEADGVPLRDIEIRGGAIAANVNDGETALIEQGVGVFQRGSMLVRAAETVVEVRGGKSVTDLALAEIRIPELTEHMTSAARFLQWDARMGRLKRVNCPRPIAETLLARAGRWRLRPLMGILNAPTLRPDGTLLDQPGYDADTGLLYDPRGVAFPTVADKPSQGDAQAALRVFDQLIGEFPFASEEARAVALAAFLTACVRRTLKAAPLFGIDGTGAGTGKGLLADTIATVGGGRPASPITAGASEEELEKRVASMLIRGDLAIVIDNLAGPLDSTFLCSVLTQATQSIRVLGQSRTLTLPTNCMFLATGNGLTFAGDMWRRAITCLIDPAMERPSERSFGFSPVRRAQKQRGAFVAAALTIMRAYQAAGSPPQHGRTMGSFEGWCRLVRDPLLWLGAADAAATCTPSDDDPERERFASVVLGWQAAIGEGRAVTLKEAIGRAVEAATATPIKAELLDAFHAVAAPMVRGGDNQIDPRRLANWVRNKRRQVIHGLRFIPGGEANSGRRWRLEKAGGRAAT